MRWACTWARNMSTTSISTIVRIAFTSRRTSHSRMVARDLRQYYVRSDGGALVPLDNIVSLKESSGPQVINHFNLFRSARKSTVLPLPVTARARV